MLRHRGLFLFATLKKWETQQSVAFTLGRRVGFHEMAKRKLLFLPKFALIYKPRFLFESDSFCSAPITSPRDGSLSFQIAIMCCPTTRRSSVKSPPACVVKDTPVHITTTAKTGGAARTSTNTGVRLVRFLPMIV